MKNILFLFTAFLFGIESSGACTRLVYHGADDDIFTARSMDWKSDIETNLWIFPKGIERNGATGKTSVKWKSKYGSIMASGYDVSTTDGLNEKGLAANVLWLAESVYPKPNEKKPTMSISIWGQYVLDNFSSVKEAVDALKKEPFDVVTALVPGEQRLAAVHLALSDKTGDSAILEYIDGKLVIHHGKQYQVMTNSPIFSKQLALEEYWKEIGGTVVLPGTNRSADRFARASFYVNAIPKSKDQRIATASVFSVIRNASVPYGITTKDQPNISSTRWRTVIDHKRLYYFFESALTPNTFWVNLNKVDFKEGAQIKKLTLGKNQTNVFSEEVSSKFEPAKSLTFLGKD